MSEYSEATDSCYSELVEDKRHITTFALNIEKCEHHQTGPLDPLLFLPPYLELLFFPNSLRHDNFFFPERNLLIQLFNLGF